MTPELRATADRITTYIEARRVMNAILRQEDNGVIDACRNVELRVTDLLTLLAAADPDEQPIPLVPTPAGLDYLAIRRRQNPKPTSTP